MRSIFLFFDLWTPELFMFDLIIGFSVKFTPRRLILRSQFSNLGQVTKTYSKTSQKASEEI